MLLLEGTNLLREALINSYIPVEIIATSEWLKKNKELVSKLPSSTILYEVTNSVLEAALTTVTPDGVASTITLNALPQCKENATFVLALDRIQDPGNIGNLFRTALAADIQAVWLASGADPFSQKSIRSSAGAILNVGFDRLGELEATAIEAMSSKLHFAAEADFQIVGTIVPGLASELGAVPYWDLNWQKPTVLVLGNEANGLHPSIQKSCTHFVTLPHNQAIESLNVASAAVPLLLERQRVKMISETQNHR